VYLDPRDLAALLADAAAAGARARARPPGAVYRAPSAARRPPAGPPSTPLSIACFFGAAMVGFGQRGDAGDAAVNDPSALSLRTRLVELVGRNNPC